MSETEVRRVIAHNGDGVPSIVHALSTLADYWRRCACGFEIGRDGKDGWQQKCECLEAELYPLQGKIERLEELSKLTTDAQQLMQQETELAEFRAEFSLLCADILAKEAPIDAEWEQAHDEAATYREMFWDAREFCAKACGIGDDEVFNAALVGFDPSQLMPGQEPSKQRMPEIVSLLRNLPREEWETQPWANPPKPVMRTIRRVTPERLRSFNVRTLKNSIEDTILPLPSAEKAVEQGGKTGHEARDAGVSAESAASDHAERSGSGQAAGAQLSKIIVPTNEDVARVVNLVAGGMPVQTAANEIAKKSEHSAGSLKTMYYKWRQTAKK
jgi:hypothetical protein